MENIIHECLDTSLNSPAFLKIIYYVNDETTPFLISLETRNSSAPTFLQVKKCIHSNISSNLNNNHNNYKYFFKTVDQESGIVCKILMEDDQEQVPIFQKNRVFCWVKERIVEAAASTDLSEIQHSVRKIYNQYILQ